MVKHYIKIAWRNLMKSKMFSVINVLGLAIGIAVCLLIFLFVNNEFTADSFHKNKNEIYQVLRYAKIDGHQKSVAYLSGLYGPALKADFPGAVDKVVRVLPNNSLVAAGHDRVFNEKKIFAVDPAFLDMFSFPLILGNDATALSNPGSIVLTETAAKRYFGNVRAAMGKTLELDKELQLKVTGVMKDVPKNSTLDFDILVPIENYKNAPYFTHWINNSMYTFVQLSPGAKIDQLEARLPGFMQKYMGKEMAQYGFNFSLGLMPLKDVYLAKDMFGAQRHGDRSIIYIFLSIAILILLIACINFVNLSTIRAVERSREIGLRKVLGAYRKQLIGQFMGESLLITCTACALAIIILYFALPFCNQMLGYQLSVDWTRPAVYIFIVSIILIVGLLAGSYPALFLSGFPPVQAIKGKLRLGTGGTNFRQVLVVVQFMISVFLIIGTIVISKQLHFVKNKQLGYDQSQAIVVRIDNGDLYDNRDLFKQKVLNEPGVEAVSLMSGEPGGFFDTYFFNVEGKTDKWSAHTEYCDFQYVKALGLKLLSGRDFSTGLPTDTTASVLLNQTAAASLGWTPEQAVGKWIQNTKNDSMRRTVIGVVADFSFESLKQSITPLVITPGDDNRLVYIRLKGGSIPATLEALQKDYGIAAPGYPFEYSFMDQQFENMYRKDIKQQKLLTSFSILAIMIASLGLFGLAVFTTNKRTKEVGIRKILGSSVSQVVLLLASDLLKPVIIAAVIAIPLGYMAMHAWLQNFAYQTRLSWWIFPLSAVITMGIALFTVCFKAIKAGRSNPVESLKVE
ncbi:ABC transporter permease [Arachidicoccus terrestris]|nr:ABC transporter permease [Arachidicoccus terrestris]